jgi:prolyl oligopeptidase
VADTLHGVNVPDPYRWLEDEKSPEVKQWMAAQDALTRTTLSRLPEREAIAQRLRELFYVDSVSPPVQRGRRLFYLRRQATKEKAVLYMRELPKNHRPGTPPPPLGSQPDASERVLIDPNTLSSDGSVSLGRWVPSKDGRRLAYALKPNNADEAILHVMDLRTGKDLPDLIEGAKYASPSWTPDGRGFYYTWLPVDKNIPTADRPGYSEIRFHRLGTPPAKDPVVRPRTNDPTVFQGVHLSRDGRYLFTSIQHGWSSTDYYVQDLRKDPKPGAALRPLVVGKKALFNVEAYSGKGAPPQGVFFVHTNEGAPRWQLFAVDPAHPERERWKQVIPQSPDAVLDEVSVVGGHLAAGYLKNAASELKVLTLQGQPVGQLPLPTVGTSSGLVGLPDQDDAYFSFSSFTYPQEVYHTSLKAGAIGKVDRFFKVALPIDPAAFEVEQVFYPSKDGTRVSMFIVHKKGLQKDGNTPTLLYGYGGFNISLTPRFSGSLYPWLERGGVYALPNLRGGGEYGEEWHQAGMGTRKQNVFDDFIAAAEWLIQNRYTRPERLAIRGGSNGGLLVGAALTQRPDLFRAVACAVPLLDMVRYHKFGSGKTWIKEYGSADDAELFKVLHAYSPYHHVQAGKRYPALLMLSADSDDRVDPMHARKMTAALQAALAGTPGARPQLLRIEKHAGHGGADLVKSEVESTTDQLSFFLWQLGMTKLK